MAAKQLVFSEDARRKLKNGMNVVANAVSATLGPKGRNVAVDRKFGSPTVTHDGVTQRLGVAYRDGRLEKKIDGDVAAGMADLAAILPVHAIDPSLHAVVEGGAPPFVHFLIDVTGYLLPTP